ncbi:MAG: hypothetical protein ACHBN1_00255 [Heteroscytonema crispum UTEX LB 1556]
MHRCLRCQTKFQLHGLRTAPNAKANPNSTLMFSFTSADDVVEVVRVAIATAATSGTIACIATRTTSQGSKDPRIERSPT